MSEPAAPGGAGGKIGERHPVTIPVEIMLRGDPHVYTQTLDHPGEPGQWSVADMERVLERLLQAVSRVLQPDGAGAPVLLRGMNWIVSPYQTGVVIALEIHSASVVAGPFDVPAATLDALIVGALGGAPAGTVIH